MELSRDKQEWRPCTKSLWCSGQKIITARNRSRLVKGKHIWKWHSSNWWRNLQSDREDISSDLGFGVVHVRKMTYSYILSSCVHRRRCIFKVCCSIRLCLWSFLHSLGGSLSLYSQSICLESDSFVSKHHGEREEGQSTTPPLWKCGHSRASLKIFI